MRFIKINNGLTIRCTGESIQSIDHIFSQLKDSNKAVKRVEGYIGASLNLIGDWGTKDHSGRSIHFIKVQIKEDWSLKDL